MKWHTIVLVMILVGSFGCTAGTQQEEGPPEPTVPGEAATPAETAIPPTETPDARPTEEATADAGSAPLSGVVDLADVTPDAAGGGEGTLREMPGPGNPRDGIVLPELSRLVAAIKGDVAQRLDVAESAVAVVSTEAKQWPDAALGCPAADTDYDQEQTPGYHLVLSANDEEFVYHTDMEGNYVWCAGGRPAGSGRVQ